MRFCPLTPWALDSPRGPAGRSSGCRSRCRKTGPAERIPEIVPSDEDEHASAVKDSADAASLMRMADAIMSNVISAKFSHNCTERGACGQEGLGRKD